MGLLDLFKKKEAPAAQPATVYAPAAGRLVAMQDIPDEVFAQGVLGRCCGIDPAAGEVYAPLDGTITQAPDTLHALGIRGDNGAEVLLHVGVDTVEMKGEGFTAHAALGDRVQKGQLLLTVDLARVAAAGHPAVVITVVTNSDEYDTIEPAAGEQVQPGDELFRLRRH